MSEAFPKLSVDELTAARKGAMKIGPFGSQLRKEEMVEHGVKVYGQENVISDDWTLGGRRISPSKFRALSSCELEPGDLVVSMMGTAGKCAVFSADAERGIMDSHLLRIQPNLALVDRDYFALALQAENVVGRQVKAMSHGSIMAGLSSKIVKQFKVPLPPLGEQPKIVEILLALDAAIHQTEAIIAKLKAVKQGLLHDLLTRGIDANGELRPPQAEAPHLYKPSSLGWIPKEWEVAPLGDLSASLVDGPFGSNLKTAHYVENPGVRVVRLQNILAGEYDDSERAFISECHAASLTRNRVAAGDTLIASLGDASYPVGRSCCYPADLPDAINKADCFRFRSGPRCLNEFVMLSMNGAAARKQVRSYEQGVTMKRINLGNLRRVEIALPSVPEQKMISERVGATQKQIDVISLELQKLQFEKAGLMDDLLTGRVRVTPLLAEAARQGGA
jgi:type I restriction enzyme, S subunit